MDYVTVSTKVSRSLMEKARKYGINLSELMRKAIEEEVRKREIEWALTIMEEISDKARLDKPSNQLIREFRDPKVR
ncbi:MAG: type II toxin-antitoxin system CcdA family antitoxin [Candidatus Methanodesulfokora washburnensis]|jgi:antitoxin CcdA